MKIEMVTNQDLEEFKISLISEIKCILANHKPKGRKSKWVKASILCDLLNIDSETLYRWRKDGIISHSRMRNNGETFYDLEEVERIFEENRRYDVTVRKAS